MWHLWAIANEMAKDIDTLVEKKFTHAGEIMTSVMLASPCRQWLFRQAALLIHSARRAPIKNRSRAGQGKSSVTHNKVGPIQTLVIGFIESLSRWG
jgi:hypothetical protein